MKAEVEIFKLDPLLKKEIELTAKELKLTKSNLIRKAIMEFISRYEFKKELEEKKADLVEKVDDINETNR